MIESVKRLELDKILYAVSEFAVTDGGREKILNAKPQTELAQAQRLLSLTEEATLLLFHLGAGNLESFPPLLDRAERAQKGATLSPQELSEVAMLLRSARVCYRSVRSFHNDNIVGLRELTEYLSFDENLEQDICDKIVGDGLADTASDKLYTIRREIRSLGERIRAKLLEHLAKDKRFLQDEVVTMRGDRFVLPVKVEYKRSVKGFIHDRSQSGQTVFIEPEEALEMNNELRSLRLDEKEEEERILAELSRSVGMLRERLERDLEILSEVDYFYSAAQYGYRYRGIKPLLGEKGIVEIIKGRHPLLEQKTAVPVSVSVGESYSFLLISGANTGGKTVTLKMCGLFCLMAMCGLFVPAAEGTRLSVFDGVYCDIGDSQSIEENLSTFSSHILNLKGILAKATRISFVLIDEPGGGTDPEEGQALAQAIVKTLLLRGARGIVTTHYSALKEFAFHQKGIENGCMEFDAESLRPLYRLRIGLPGASNALLICSRLGLDEEVIEEARGHLSDGARAFEHTVRAAEESRIQADEVKNKALAVEKEWRERMAKLEIEEEKFRKERERFMASSKAEARRIINSRTEEAEEILLEIEQIFAKERLTELDLIKARTLKNKISLQGLDEEEAPTRAIPVDRDKVQLGDTVYLPNVNQEGVVVTLKREKNTAEVQCGMMKVRSKITELYLPAPKKEEKEQVRVVKNLNQRQTVARECNVIGLSVAEALVEVESFLDGALLQNVSEVRIVHGMGTGKLRVAIHDYLKKHKRVAEYRLGKYGEGESGVTIATIG